jgi:hypothetical protein
VDPTKEARLVALLSRLDTPLHRVLASLVGGLGTVAGIGFAGIPRLIGPNALRLRWPQTGWFALEVFGVGTAGGVVGHFLIVSVARGPLRRRALMVGGPMGLVTATTAWAVTYLGRSALSPFEPSQDAERTLRNSLRTGLVAGPVAGVVVSLIVMRILESVARQVSYLSRV